MRLPPCPETFKGTIGFAAAALSVLDPSLAGYGWSKKEPDSGPDFRLTRSRHPSASGRRIESSADGGLAARRDPSITGVFYEAEL
jgi:hypothetical protein